MDETRAALAALTSPAGQAAVTAGDLGRVLKVVREARGLWQSEVAGLAGYSQPSVSRAERNQLHDPVVLADLADTLHIPRSVFNDLAHTFRPVPRLVDVERRDFLKGALGMASAALLPTAVAEAQVGARVGASEVRASWSALDRLHLLESDHGGGAVYELTASLAKRLQRCLDRTSYSAAVGRDLRSVTAAATERAGWRAYDAGDRAGARRWWMETVHMTKLGDCAEEYHVYALAGLSRNASDGESNGREAVALAEAAMSSTHRSPALMSLLSAREAIGHAAAKDTKAASVSLRRSRRHLSKSEPESEPAWLAFWGPSDLAAHERQCALLAGDFSTALCAAREAVSMTNNDTMARNRAIYSAQLGSVLARTGQLEEAVAVSQDVLTQPCLDGSGRIRDQLLETAAVLDSHSYEPGQRFAGTVRRILTAA